MKIDRFWLKPSNLLPFGLLTITVFVPLVYSQENISVSAWQLFSLFLIPLTLTKKYLANDNGFLFWIFIFTLLAIAILQPIAIHASQFFFKSWLLYMSQLSIFALIALLYKKSELFEFFSRFIVFASFLLAAVMIIQFVTGSTTGNPRSYFGAENPASFWTLQDTKLIRPLGTLDNPNTSGAFLLISLPFIFYFYSIYKNQSLIISILVILLAIVLTMSRGVIMGLFILVASYFWGQYYFLLRKLFLSKTGLFVIVTVFGAIFSFVLLSQGYSESVVTRFEMLFEPSSTGEHLNRGTAAFRFLMIWIGILAGLDHPFFGVGLGGSAYILSDYSALIPEWWQHRIHSFTPALFAEAGALSGLIWLYFQLVALYRSFKCMVHYGDSLNRAVFSANLIGFYLSWFYMILHSIEFGAIYFIILLIGLKRYYPTSKAQESAS